MYVAKGVDYALGSRFPRLFKKLGAKDLSIENDVPMVQGGSGIARMMRLSLVQLKERYLATGEVDAGDLDPYSRFAENPDSAAIYYATVAAIGWK